MARNLIRKENGILVGEIEDKSALSNPIARALVAGYDRCFLNFFTAAFPASVHEVGCGSGRLARLMRTVYDGPLLLSDISRALTEGHVLAIEPNTRVVQLSVYDVQAEHQADLLVCCEMLEHLESPEEALRALKKLGCRSYLFSVPSEPLWRALNLARLRYVRHWGNTPGHLQHWSRADFLTLLQKSGFAVERVGTPVPWTMVLAT